MIFAPAEPQTACRPCPTIWRLSFDAHSARELRSALDLQYDIWEADVMGRLLAREAPRVADRGVEVPLLRDDRYIRRSERELTTLAWRPCIKVWLYKPFHFRP